MSQLPLPDPEEENHLTEAFRADVRTVCLVILAILALIATLDFASAIAFPMTLAFMLNLVLRAPVRWFGWLGIPHLPAAALVLLVLLAGAVLGAIRLVEPAGDLLDNVPRYARQVEWKLRSLKKPMERLEATSKKVDELTKTEDVTTPQVQVQESSTGATLLLGTGEFLSGAAITFFLVFFLLARGDRFLLKAVEAVPRFSDKRRVVELSRGITHDISVYLFTITAINLSLGVCVGVGMWLSGMPNPILFGVMAAAFNFVPFVGGLAGVTLVFFMSLVEFDHLGPALVPPAIYGVLTVLEGFVVTPMLVGRSMSLNPVAVFVSLIVWGWLWGIGGALLAVPMLAVLKIACDRVEALENLGRFLSA